jgi:hypothetical protein
MNLTQYTSDDHSNRPVEVTGLFASIQSRYKSRFISSFNPLVSTLAAKLRISSLALLFAFSASALAAESQWRRGVSGVATIGRPEARGVEILAWRGHKG